MQKLKFLSFLILLWLENVTHTCAAANASQNVHYTEDAQIVQKCLIDRVSKDIQKVSNFGNWNNGEEVLCFTRCLSVAKGWYNATESNWIKQKIITDLGEDLWKYCKYELERTYDNECEYVHQGFRCLRMAEKNTRQTYMTLLNCAVGLGSDLNELRKYSNFDEQEQIPCLFKCFAEINALYDANFEWNFINWTKAFGPFDVEAAALSCRISKEQKGGNSCVWMYKEYLCLEQLGDSKSLETTPTINMHNSEETTSEVVRESLKLQSEPNVIDANATIVQERNDIPDKNSTIETVVSAATVLQESIDIQNINNAINANTTVLQESIDIQNINNVINVNRTVIPESIDLHDKNSTEEIVASAATVLQESIDIQDKNDEIAADTTVVGENIALQDKNSTIETGSTATTVTRASA